MCKLSTRELFTPRNEYNKNDVLFDRKGLGKGNSTNTEGWLHYKALINSVTNEYHDLESGKHAYVYHHVIKPVHESGGRFICLKRNEKLSIDDTLRKIKQALKDNKKNKNRTSPTASKETSDAMDMDSKKDHTATTSTENVHVREGIKKRSRSSSDESESERESKMDESESTEQWVNKSRRLSIEHHTEIKVDKTATASTDVSLIQPQPIPDYPLNVNVRESIKKRSRSSRGESESNDERESNLNELKLSEERGSKFRRFSIEHHDATESMLVDITNNMLRLN